MAGSAYLSLGQTQQDVANLDVFLHGSPGADAEAFRELDLGLGSSGFCFTLQQLGGIPINVFQNLFIFL